MKITADTITDEQIRELMRTQSPVTGNCAYVCSIALGAGSCAMYPCAPTTPEEIRDARARCAEILNARAGAK